MKKCVLIALMIASAVSCGLEEVGRRPQDGKGDVWVRPGAGLDSTANDDYTVYVAAMEYHEWYDWRKDEEKGSVKCSLVVYSNGSPILKVPVGDRYEVSSDPDTHRFAGGHLYTDYSSDTETVIKKDGHEFMRYSGREMICSLIEYEGHVYTLGHNRDGEGFAFRRDGEIMVSRERGNTFGRLHLDGGTVAFAFRESISASGGDIERYYYAMGDKVSQVALREDLVKVWDIVPYKDAMAYLATVVGVPSPVLFAPEGIQALVFTESTVLLAGSICVDGDVLYVEGLMERDGTRVLNGLWNSDGSIYVFPAGQTVFSMLISGDRPCCILNPSKSNTGFIYKCGETFYMPQGYVALGSHPAAISGGILHVGLSSRIGDHPLIWRDGESTPLKINGFISALSTN